MVPENSLLLKSQWNEIFETIQRLGLNHQDFERLEYLSINTPNLIVSQLTHKLTLPALSSNNLDLAAISNS